MFVLTVKCRGYLHVFLFTNAIYGKQLRTGTCGKNGIFSGQNARVYWLQNITNLFKIGFAVCDSCWTGDLLFTYLYRKSNFQPSLG